MRPTGSALQTGPDQEGGHLLAEHVVVRAVEIRLCGIAAERDAGGGDGVDGPLVDRTVVIGVAI